MFSVPVKYGGVIGGELSVNVISRSTFHFFCSLHLTPSFSPFCISTLPFTPLLSLFPLSLPLSFPFSLPLISPPSLSSSLSLSLPLSFPPLFSHPFLSPSRYWVTTSAGSRTQRHLSVRSSTSPATLTTNTSST